MLCSRLQAAVLRTEVEESRDRSAAPQRENAGLWSKASLHLAAGIFSAAPDNLDDDLLSRRLAAHKRGHADDALPPDHADFDRRTVRHAPSGSRPPPSSMK